MSEQTVHLSLPQAKYYPVWVRLLRRFWVLSGLILLGAALLGGCVSPAGGAPDGLPARPGPFRGPMAADGGGSLPPQKLVSYDREVLFVIGISKRHGQWGPLPNARLDAEEFAEWMRGRGARVFDLWDEEATRTTIFDEWERALEAAKGRTGEARTLLVFYFSGHGTAGHLVPYNAKGKSDHISMKQVEEWASPKTGVRHQLFILSSCYSGSVFRSNELKTRQFLRTYAKAARWFAKSLRRRARLALTAGQDDERVPDGPEGAGSRFGRAVLRAVERAPGAPWANADHNEDGCVSSYELGAYVHAYGGWGGVTQPHFGALPGDRQGVVAFCEGAPKAADPEKVAGSFKGPVEESPPSPGFTSGSVVLQASRFRPAMVGVRGGRFTMGSPPEERFRESDEAQREVEVGDFLIAQTEVTQGQWTAVMGSNPSLFLPTNGGGPNHPVERVSWWDALAYLNRLSDEEGLRACYDLSGCERKRGTFTCSKRVERIPRCSGYRLPSEAEWEYAARAGTNTALYSGPVSYQDVQGVRSQEVDALAWYSGNSDGRTHPVGVLPANAWGLRDVLGNVWEWTDSWYNRKSVVDRGCGWNDYAGYCRAALRNAFSPGFRDAGLGFRLARSVP